MKKIIYLMTLALAFINVSCASLGFNTANGMCTCTCEACINCKVHHHTVTPEVQARLDSINNVKNAEEQRKRAELDSLLMIDYSTHTYVIEDPQERLPYKWEEDEVIDAELDSITPMFKVTNLVDKLEFVNKSVNTSPKKNGNYLYFNTKDGAASDLHFVVHFYADDAVNFHKLILYADEFTYEYTPKNLKRSRDGQFYMENFDDVVDESLQDFIAALAKCEFANMILVSDGGVNHRIVFRPEQLKQIRTTYQLYRILQR